MKKTIRRSVQQKAKLTARLEHTKGWARNRLKRMRTAANMGKDFKEHQEAMSMITGWERAQVLKATGKNSVFGISASQIFSIVKFHRNKRREREGKPIEALI